MRDRIIEMIDSLENELIEMSEKIYNHPELGYEEVESCAIHVAILKKYGFEVEENYWDIKTAFKAEYTSTKPGPSIAYLAEYDALPGIGHGCGHNILGTVSTGSGIVLKNIIDELGGKVVVFGTPAEETSGAKVYFAEKGAFDDMDVALIAHPDNGYFKSGDSLALEAIQFAFRGKTAHAASSPEMGINALDAVINTFNNINALREHIRSDARIHGIIRKGGEAANIVPDYAVAEFYVRATKKAYLRELVERVNNCARGASLAAGTELEISNYEASYDDMVTNQTLSEAFNENLKTLGCLTMEEAKKNSGSIDAGNVSYCCPTIHSYFDITNDPNIVAHTRAFAEASTTSYAYNEMKRTIAALVLTAVDVIQDEELLLKIKEEFNNI